MAVLMRLRFDVDLSHRAHSPCRFPDCERCSNVLLAKASGSDVQQVKINAHPQQCKHHHPGNIGMKLIKDKEA